jgi:hypothetical protein
MTRPQVWISTTSKHIDYDGETPGNHWTLVGEIDSTQERAFLAAHVYGRTRGKSDFYLDGDPDVEWVQRADEQPQFWLAIDQWGSMRTSIQGAVPPSWSAGRRHGCRSLDDGLQSPIPAASLDRSRCRSGSEGSKVRCSPKLSLRPDQHAASSLWPHRRSGPAK